MDDLDQRRRIAWRAAQDLRDGCSVNLGIGIPTLVPSFVPAGLEIIYQSENGLIGMGPPPAEGQEDPDLINASKDPVTLVPGAAVCDSTDAFAIMRGGHLDLAMMGAFEVSADGSIANWTLDRKNVPPGVGGAMDLAAGAKSLWVLMQHVTPGGQSRIVNRLSLPATAIGVARRIYTDLAIIDLEGGRLTVREIFHPATPELVRTCTGVELTIPADIRISRLPDL